MSKIFPHIRKKGDVKGCDTLLRKAQQEMARTRMMADQSGVPVTQRYTAIDEERGIYILTRASLGQDIIEIVYPYQESPSLKEEPEEEKDIYEPKYIGFYSGLTTMNDTTIGAWPEYGAGDFNKFNPTIDCREAYPQDFEDGVAYNEVQRIALRPTASIQMDGSFPTGPRQDNLNYDAQTHLVKACQYTGPIAEIVAVLLGLGTNHMSGDERVELLGSEAHPSWVANVQVNGFTVQYDFKFLRCHQVIQKRTDKTWWLMEFSELNGVIVRALPMLYGEVMIGEIEPGSDAALFIKKFGGIPSGEAFPTSRNDILDGISEGWINELMNPNSYDSQFLEDQNSYSILNSWAFNEDSTEARTTTYKYDNNGFHENHYWKMAISDSVLFSPDIDLIDSGICCGPRNEADHGQTAAFMPNNNALLGVLFYDPEPGQAQQYRHRFRDLYLPTTGNHNDYAGIPAVMDQVVWVGRVNGRWEEVHYRQNLVGSWIRNDHEIVTHDADGNESDHAWHSVQLNDMNGNGTKQVPGPQWEISFLHNYSTSIEFDHPITWYAGDHMYFQSWSRRIVTDILSGTEGHAQNHGAWETDYLWVDDDNVQPSSRSVFMVCGWNRNAYIEYSHHHEPATDTSNISNKNMLNKYWLWTQGYQHGPVTAACPPLGAWGGLTGNENPIPESFSDKNTVTGLYETGYEGYPSSNIGLYGTPYDFADDAVSGGPPVLSDDECWPDWECTAIYVHVGWGNYVIDHYEPNGFLEHKTAAREYEPGTGTPATWYTTLFPDMLSDWWGYCQGWTTHDVYIEAAGAVYPKSAQVSVNIAKPGDDLWPLPFYEHSVWTNQIHIVGHRVPGEKITLYDESFPLTPDDPYRVSQRNLEYTGYVHTSTLGPEAAIYPDVEKQTGSTTASYQSEYISSGTMPSLPENVTDVELWWTCTFVGINGPSNP